MTNAYQELSAYSSWVSWRNEVVNGSHTKVPYNPTTGSRADSSDPQTWTTSEHAYNGTAHHYSGAGFVLSDTDPFTCIDLDNPFVRKLNGQVYQITAENDPAAYAEACEVWASYDSIIRDFDSYTEWSPSGSGFHIWIKGKLPVEWGKRRGTFEVYSRLRFMTITGRSYHAEPKPINERQGALELFAMKLGLEPGNLSHVESRPETQSDIDLYTRIANSGCGADFQALFAMDSTTYTGDKSARDLALANYIGAFTDNLEQCERLFKFSNWYQSREKLIARPDLVSRVVRLSFDRKPPPIDISEVLRKVEEVRQQWQTPALDIAPSDAAPVNLPVPHYSNVTSEMPPGVLGDIANYLYSVSPRPIPETALAGAIVFLAGVAGRSYNISGTGLNQYIVMLGASGVGKEAISSGLSRLIAEIKPTLPAVTMFQGPSLIQSAPALYKMFGPQDQQGATPSFFSIIGEFGKKLKVMTDPRASANDQMLHAAYLDLYQKSGRGNVAGGIRYSESAKNILHVNAPAFSFIGDTVPGRFFDACTAEAIEGGLVPRMMLIQYDGDRPHRKKFDPFYRLDDEAGRRIKALIEVCLMRNQMHDPIEVGMMADAERLLDELDLECDALWNKAKGNEVKQAIWNRVHLKALKLAALRAVGNSPHEPVIARQDAEWAIRFVKNDASILLSRFDTGEVSGGNTDDDKVRALKLVIGRWLLEGMDYAPPSYHDRFSAYWPDAGIVPYTLLSTKLSTNKAFKPTHVKGTQELILSALKDMERQGLLVVLNGKIAAESAELLKLGVTGQAVYAHIKEPATMVEGIAPRTRKTKTKTPEEPV